MDVANYFDNAATTPLDPQVLAEMMPFLEADFGNANSLHSWGQRARAAVELARERVASLLSCAPDEVVFTSGATEANNWVLQSHHDVVVSPFEHSSVWETAKALDFHFLENDGWNLEIEGEYDLLSVMLVNNETGAILAPPRLQSAKLQRDLTQAVGKLTIDLSGVDYASLSAHKFHGPKGVGALYIKNAEPLEPLLYGGEQESGLRAGTLNVAGIVGLGAACAVAQERMDGVTTHVQSLRAKLLESLTETSDWTANEHGENSPYILSLSFLGIEGETLVIESDTRGFAISSGAACSSRSNEPSHVLTALGVEEPWLRGTIRVSFSHLNTIESVANLAKVLKSVVNDLRSKGQ